MAHISRALVRQIRYFKGSSTGLFTTFNGTQAQLRVLSALFPEYLKHPAQRRVPNSFEECQGQKNKIQNKNFNIFKAVKQENVYKSQLSEGAVLQFVNKLLNAYEVALGTPGFERHLRAFTNDKDFIKLCGMLESKVHQYSVETLLLLYDLEYFNVQQKNPLMIKISKSVLDKFNNCSLYEKLLIYGTTLRKPCKERNRKNIIEQCETYVKKVLDFDLQCKESSFVLTSLFNIEGLPRHVILVLVEKLYDNILCDVADKKHSLAIFYKLACTDHDLLSKEKWFNLLTYCMRSNLSLPLLRMISSLYIALLKKDKLYYFPEFIELMAKAESGKRCFSEAPKIGDGLCAQGYFIRDFLDELIKNFGLLPKSLGKQETIMAVLRFLAQASFHEVVAQSDVQHVKNILERVKICEIASQLPNNSLFCMYLTYIGCDTRALLSSIFKIANDETEATDSNLLTLHHLAKAYFPGEYEPLSQNTVNSLVQDEFRKSGLWDPENSMGKCFESEDFILRNCVTSDKHCLHFVTVFQSDRQPVNLANYSKMSNPKVFFNIDTIKKPHGSKIIAFVLFPYEQPIKFLNVPSMSGSAKMYLKSFEGVNSNIVLLHKTFFSLNLEDKKKFLKSQIDEIFENSSSEK